MFGSEKEIQSVKRFTHNQRSSFVAFNNIGKHSSTCIFLTSFGVLSRRLYINQLEELHENVFGNLENLEEL